MNAETRTGKRTVPGSFSIEKLIRSTRENGMKLRWLLEDDPEKALRQIKKIIGRGRKAQIGLLARTLNLHLENHPHALADLVVMISRDDSVILEALSDAGFKKLQ